MHGDGMDAAIRTHCLSGADTCLVFASSADAIDLIYLGPLLPTGENFAGLAASGEFGRHENQPDVPPVGGLLPEAKNGYAGRPALWLRVDGEAVATDCVSQAVTATSRSLTAIWLDRASQLEVSTSWELDADDMIRCRYRFANRGDKPITLEGAPSLVLPLPMRFNTMTSFPGRWAAEMQQVQNKLGRGAIEMRSTGGKPGFDPGNWLLFDGDDRGGVIGCHLAWPGDHYAHVVQDSDGRAILIMAAAAESDHAVLAPGQDYSSASAVVAYAHDQDRLGQKFHNHVRKAVLPRRSEWGPRKVHLNTWEALGFDLSEAALIALADQAAMLGVERFVLDDGWFKGRRSDRAGLGDWIVDPEILPNGLTALIDHVKAQGMDFGLWIEPEMVSEDSDLYRRHSDWCLHSGEARPTQRHQLVLDLARVEVRDHLAAAIDRLLESHDIAYLKWDHNRSLFPPGTGQTLGYLQLLAEISRRHPQVEIENCASGGGRIDFNSLSFAHRVWPSDNNDPIERLRINRGWTRFLPLEVLGNHVGPSPNPITGRRTAMDFRAKVALFGHMGVEANPGEMEPNERAVLADHIELYKQWRGVLHGGTLWQLKHDHAGFHGQIVVQGDRAIAFAAQTTFAADFNIAPVRMKGLEPDARYRVMLPRPWPEPARRYLADPALWHGSLVLSGTALMERGLALPLIHPETAWIILLEKDCDA
jgi:alpha-galactosidase